MKGRQMCNFYICWEHMFSLGRGKYSKPKPVKYNAQEAILSA